MVKKGLLAIASIGCALSALAFVMYVRNPPPPVPAISASEAASPTKPYVVKIHAKWCAVCMVTKAVWSHIETEYGTRANLVVFDFTNQATSDNSRAEAKRLGLEGVFDENVGWTGTVLIVDGRTKAVTASIHGGRDVAEYRTAIEAALRPGTK